MQSAKALPQRFSDVEVRHMNRKKQGAPFDLRDPIVPEVRGAADSGSDIVTPGTAQPGPSAEF